MSTDETLLKPYQHIAQRKGKEVRKALILALNKWLKVPETPLATIISVIDKLHNASLVVDDIEDSSPLRRGVPAAHVVYGVPWALNAANLVYFLAMQELSALGNPQATAVMVEELVHLHRGQGLDIMWRDTATCPSMQQYKYMVTQKTGGLFRLCVRLMQQFSATNLDLVPLAEELGLVFQIRDDYLNLTADQYAAGKGFCEDIQEGKFSFPIIFALLHGSAAQQQSLMAILKARPKDRATKQRALDILEQSKALDRTRTILSEHRAQLGKLLSGLPDNKAMTSLIAKLSKGVRATPTSPVSTATSSSNTAHSTSAACETKEAVLSDASSDASATQLSGAENHVDCAVDAHRHSAHTDVSTPTATVPVAVPGS